MNSLLTLLAIICAAYAHNLTCPKYVCENKPVGLNEECAIERMHELDIKKCTPGLMCQPIELDASSVCVEAVIPDGSILPGENCTEHKQCTIGNCLNNICDGIKDSLPCELTSQCNKGLYCKDKLCKPTGAVCDNEGKGCSLNMMCNKAEGKCYRYTSIDNGNPAPFPAACKTYYLGPDGNCTDGPKLKELIAMKNLECPDSGFCDYELGSKKLRVPCICTKDKTGEKQCPPGKGDIDVDAVILI